MTGMDRDVNCKCVCREKSCPVVGQERNALCQCVCKEKTTWSNTQNRCVGDDENCGGNEEKPDKGEAEVPGRELTEQNKALIIVPPSDDENPADPIDFTVLHRIITEDSPDKRDLKGKMKLTFKSGDASAFDLETDQGLGFIPYALGTEIPVEEPGHEGCGLHDWHAGLQEFRVKSKKKGVLTVTASVKPDRTGGVISREVEITFLMGQVTEVGFGGQKYWQLKSDDGENIYSAPHWKDVDGDGKPTDVGQGERNYSVAFTRNTKPKITAKFKIAGASDFAAVKIKATGPGGLTIPETAASVSGDEIVMPSTEASSALINVIKFYDRKEDSKAFKLKWEMKADDYEWCPLGVTKHTVYVVLADPETSLRQETLFEISCRRAEGIDQATDVTDAIWSEFTDRVVKRVDGVQLTYYNDYLCSNVTTGDLLKFGDGQCGAWAKLFIDLRKIQGIDDTNEYVIFLGVAADGFVVKNWSFSGAGTSGIAEYPYLNIPEDNLVGNNGYNWRFAEVNDEAGIPGQGNPNPASLFSNHQVVIAGEYYDPSYGIKHANLQAIDDNSIDGFFVGPALHPIDEPAVDLDLNDDGDKVDIGVNTRIMIFRKNSSGLDLTEQIFDY